MHQDGWTGNWPVDVSYSSFQFPIIFWLIGPDFQTLELAKGTPVMVTLLFAGMSRMEKMVVVKRLVAILKAAGFEKAISFNRKL